MDSKQNLAHKLAMEGHSLLITGQAGCGKTWTLNQIVQDLCQAGKVVEVTAMTGLYKTFLNPRLNSM